ncbi:hypothetical protein CEV34_4766 [Brucella pseudogrignonensis]|uniref:Uncharacterized protein n=1 Tax=Brucella pseudogrignonensis TaxID=419475 RepID=A0A256G4C6_9HYPH|nr:hypothetical protein CEV34_4766 [Brucella pseudogrignonensis]
MSKYGEKASAQGIYDRCRDGLITVHYTPKHVCIAGLLW